MRRITECRCRPIVQLEMGTTAAIEAPPTAAIETPPTAAIEAPPTTALEAPPTTATEAPTTTAVEPPPTTNRSQSAIPAAQLTEAQIRNNGPVVGPNQEFCRIGSAIVDNAIERD